MCVCTYCMCVLHLRLQTLRVVTMMIDDTRNASLHLSVQMIFQLPISDSFYPVKRDYFFPVKRGANPLYRITKRDYKPS